jgi:hypothetical protein
MDLLLVCVRVFVSSSGPVTTADGAAGFLLFSFIDGVCALSASNTIHLLVCSCHRNCTPRLALVYTFPSLYTSVTETASSKQ